MRSFAARQTRIRNPNENQQNHIRTLPASVLKDVERLAPLEDPGIAVPAGTVCCRLIIDSSLGESKSRPGLVPQPILAGTFSPPVSPSLVSAPQNGSRNYSKNRARPGGICSRLLIKHSVEHPCSGPARHCFLANNLAGSAVLFLEPVSLHVLFLRLLRLCPCAPVIGSRSASRSTRTWPPCKPASPLKRSFRPVMAYRVCVSRPANSARLSLTSLLGVKYGMLLAGTSTRAPVLGLRAIRP